MEHVDKERMGEENENLVLIGHPKGSTVFKEGNEHQL